MADAPAPDSEPTGGAVVQSPMAVTSRGVDGRQIPASRWAGPWMPLAALIGVFGVAVQIVVFLHRRALRLDEAMLGLNIIDRSYATLLRPLDFEQTAPVLFLWASKTIVLIGGVDERVLRTVPFVAGLALIPLVWYAARRLLGTVGGAALAAASAAVCPIVMAYADFLKPYASDAAVSALLLVLALRVIDTPALRPPWWVLGGACSLGVFFSAPSVLVTAAIVAAISMSPAVRADGAQRRLAALLVTWSACAAINFFGLQRPTVRNTYIQRYWEGAFFRPPLSHMLELARGRIGWTFQELYLGEAQPYPVAVRLLLVVAALSGLFALTRRHGRWLPILLAGPVLAAVVASAFRFYPLSERTLLFAAPSILIAVAAGLESFAGVATPGAAKAGGLIFTALGVLLLTPAAIDATLRLGGALSTDPFRGAVADLIGRARPDAPVYLFSRDVPIWTFYTTNWRSPDTARVRQLSDLAASAGPNSGNMPGRGHPVENEGLDLVVHAGRRDELIGVPTGMQARFADVSQQMPDPGWATNEAGRIRAVANPDVWLFFTYCHNVCDSTLIDTLAAAGGRIAFQKKVPGARIYEYIRQ